MTRRSFRLPALASAAALALVAPSATAQHVVYDPTNYASNVMQAARALEQINNQIVSLQNEAQMLIGQAKNLAGLPYSSVRRVQAQVQRTQQLLAQTKRIAYDVRSIDDAFKGAYSTGELTANDKALIRRARERWSNSVDALQDALKVQSSIVQGVEVTRSEMEELVSRSQSAEGALQAAQAGNQLLALQAKQLAELSALMAAQGRAEALEAADRAATREEARARFRRFMGERRR